MMLWLRKKKNKRKPSRQHSLYKEIVTGHGKISLSLLLLLQKPETKTIAYSFTQQIVIAMAIV